jgi:hypothetical protein
MGYKSVSRSMGSVKGYPKLYFIETDFKVYGPWTTTPKSHFKNTFLKNDVDAYLVKFEYNPELGVYQKEYLDIQLTEKDLAK